MVVDVSVLEVGSSILRDLFVVRVAVRVEELLPSFVVRVLGIGVVAARD